MYNSKYECRYHKDDVFLATDEVTEDEKEYVRNILYREDLLNIFYFEESDLFKKFDEIIYELYKIVSGETGLRECMKQASAKLISEDEELGLCILFSYNLMHHTHACICEYLEHGFIQESTLQTLRNEINQAN
jgi:hypothetical protein